MPVRHHPREPVVERLADGRRVLIRPLRRPDATALEAAYQRLSWDAKVARFGSPPRTLLGSPMRTLVDRVDQHDHVALIAIPFDVDFDGRGPIVAVGRLVPYLAEPGVYDIGVTVADDWRRVRLASRLLEHLWWHRPEPLQRLRTSVQPGNEAVDRLLRRLGPVRRHGDQVEVDVDPELDDVLRRQLREHSHGRVELPFHLA
jgi:RimJ/RimL family protein N-acetyltransferase